MNGAESLDLVAARGHLATAAERPVCENCGFPPGASGCAPAQSPGCVVLDPQSMLGWIGGPPATTRSRLLYQCRWLENYFAFPLAPGAYPAPPCDVRAVQKPNGDSVVEIELSSFRAEMQQVRPLWQGAASSNRTVLRGELNAVIHEAVLNCLSRHRPAEPAEGGPIEAPWLLGHDVWAMMEDRWIASRLALMQPGRALPLAVETVETFWNGIVHSEAAGSFCYMDEAVSALTRLSAGLSMAGRPDEADEILHMAWQLFLEYQSSHATSDRSDVGIPLCALLVGWAMRDAGALGLATILASDGWKITIPESAPTTGPTWQASATRQVPAQAPTR